MVALIISFILIMFILDLSISLVNYNQRMLPLPENVKGIYDDEAYIKWLAYTMEKLKLELIGKTVNLIMMIGFLSFGFFRALDQFTLSISSNPIVSTLLFLGIFMGGTFILGLPFEWIDTFRIETKYGFNKTSVKTFWIDQIKGLVLGGFLLGILIVILQSLYLLFIDQLIQFGIWAFAAISVITVLLFFFSRLFVRVFNKLQPIEEGELKEKINALAQKCGFRVKSVFVMDGSRRSTKLNGFYTGFGKTGEIVLYDTLINKMTHEEILAVLAHELGHAKHGDTVRMLGVQNIQMGYYIVLITAILMNPGLFTPFGFTGVHFGFAFILFTVLAEPLSLILSFVSNGLLRIAETKADAYAVEMTSKETMGSVLRILAAENFSNLNPHPLYVLMHYSHPPVSQRLSDINK
jgi:STE24 endopeptidase